jgi:hypothetical protein
MWRRRTMKLVMALLEGDSRSAVAATPPALEQVEL